jgi:hypothetical protein
MEWYVVSRGEPLRWAYQGCLPFSVVVVAVQLEDVVVTRVLPQSEKNMSTVTVFDIELVEVWGG